MKLIQTTDAVGTVLCHDVTQIIKGVTKDAVFRKGHIIREEDIPILLSIGKENLYVWENQAGMLHENDAAEILKQLCQGENIHSSAVKEGKIELIADCDGLLKVNVAAMNRVNALGEMMIASRHGNFPVKKGDKLAGTRIIPLVIEAEKMKRAQQTAGDTPIFDVLPYQKKKAAVITTGSEVYYGRIQDTFAPVVIEKLQEYGVEICGTTCCNDEADMVTDAINDWRSKGTDLIVCTGGMSVDPDDRTPLAIKNAATEVITYGAPVLPGAMFMLAYHGDIPIMGLPGCVMYAKRTIFDLALPRLLAGERLTREDFCTLGQGGLCLSCPQCTFPNCGFGKH